MKYMDEFRDPHTVRSLQRQLARVTTRPWVIMEVCGGQTHNIVRFGLDRMLPEGLELIHGPGCPVCVTPTAKIDRAIALAAHPEVVVCSYGDMLRVPGSQSDLLTAKSQGGDVRIVYSPLEAVELATAEPERHVVFFAVGFETTAPANAMAVYEAKRRGVDNFTVLVSQVLVPPAMETILQAPACRVQGFLAAGHVCTITGFGAYEGLAEQYQVPIVVTGFEPVDILEGLFRCVSQLERGVHNVENQYARSVIREGNPRAQEVLGEVYEVTDMEWRGMGAISSSGLRLRAPYRDFDAESRWGMHQGSNADPSPSRCRAGEVLQGLIRPYECSQFGKGCRPEQPLGAPMVSGEGACAAYYRYRRGGARGKNW